MTGNPWPGPNEKQVIAEMLENRDSEHWTKCNEFMRWLVVKESSKYFPPFSADLIEEVWQNALVSVVTGLPDFRAKSKLTTWLTTIAYNRTIDALRLRRRNRQIFTTLTTLIEEEETEVVTYELEVSGTLEEMCMTSETLREVRDEILVYIGSHASSERNRKLAHMVLFEGRTLEAAAREVGISAAVASYFIRTLRQHLEERFGPPHQE